MHTSSACYTKSAYWLRNKEIKSVVTIVCYNRIKLQNKYITDIPIFGNIYIQDIQEKQCMHVQVRKTQSRTMSLLLNQNHKQMAQEKKYTFPPVLVKFNN